MGLMAVLRGSETARRRLAFALVALCIGLFTAFGGGKELKDIFENMTSADQLTKFSTAFTGPLDRALPVTLIKIDEETRRAWGDEAITPRAPLALLIRMAREAKAKAILVDIDFTGDGPGDTSNTDLLGELAQYPPDAPLLMLVRVLNSGGTDITPYDHAVEGLANVVWVAAEPEPDRDRVVRKVKLWATQCKGNDGNTYAAPALQLAALVNGKRAALDAFLADEKDAVCGNAERKAVAWPAGRKQSARVPYVIWSNADTIGNDFIKQGGADVALSQNLAALHLVSYAAPKAEAMGAVSETLFRDRVAVIGVTHNFTRDIHGTPLGAMPGSVILANTAAMASYMADTPELSTLKKYALVVPLFIFLGLIGVRLQLAASTFIVGLLSLALLIVLSRHLGFGSAVEVMANVLVMYGLFKLADSVVGIVHDWRGGHGWRAILKPHRH